MILMDFVRITIFTSVTDKCCHSQLFIQNVSHHLPLISNHIEICNIHYIISVHLIFDVHCLRISGTAEKFDLSHVLFVITFLLVSFSFQICNTSISLASTDSAVRRFMDFRHYRINPCLISFERIRLTFLQQFVFREQSFHFIIEYTMSKCVRVFLCENLHCLFQCSDIALLSHRDDSLLIGMTQYSALVCIFIVKYIMFHYFSSFFFIVIRVVYSIFFESMTYHCVHNCFLFFSHGIDYVFNGFFSSFRSLIFLFFCHF